MTRDHLKTIIIITGPTASGKSQFALDLASLYQGVILNADSVELYCDLPILSACPSPEDFKKVQHYFYRILNPLEQWNAALWCDHVLDLLKTPELQNRIFFVVGGTGFYIKGLMEGFSPIPKIHADYRQAARRQLERHGYNQFFQDIATFDPKIAQCLNPHDTQRLIRAWEVYHGTGKPFSYWQGQPKNCQTKQYRFVTFYLNPPRSLLVEQADRRFDQMINQGALKEIQHLIDENIPEESPIYKTLGALPLAHYLNGQHALEQAMSIAKKSTYHYIKRQQTWFRHQLTSCQKIDDFYSKDALRYAQSVLKELDT